jgi:hypothetical protein
MGLITVKALKPAAGEDKTFASEYALTLSDQGFLGTGALTLFSVNLINDSNTDLRDEVIGFLSSTNFTVSSDQAFSVGGVDYFQGAAQTSSSDVAFQGS